MMPNDPLQPIGPASGSLGIEIADFEKAQELWQRYGAAPRR